jgi:hypothetical protein
MKKGMITMSMEHEHINDKTVAISVKAVKITGRLLAKAMEAFLKKIRNPPGKHGEQSIKSLTKQGASLTDIDISGDNIGTFKKTARKFNIDLALKRDDSTNPPKWIVFFKAKDDKAMQSAFRDYTSAILVKKTRKASMLTKINRFKALAKSTPHKVLEKVKDKFR